MYLKVYLRHGEKLLTWFTRLQIAIVEKNPELIDELMEDIPEFKDINEMKSAASLIQEALRLLHTLRDETGETLVKLQKHKNFLESTRNVSLNKLDITS